MPSAFSSATEWGDAKAQANKKNLTPAANFMSLSLSFSCEQVNFTE